MILVYVSIILYSALFCLEIHNSYKYLWLKRKYKVFPVCLFYVISIPATVFRIYENIWIVKICAYEENWTLVMPSIFKLCVGISQILVMVELTIRIEQSMQSRCEIRTGSRDVYDTWVIVSRTISVVIISTLMIGWTLCYFIIFNKFEIDNKSPSQEEIDFMLNTGPLVGHIFLIMTFPLFLSITAVIWRLRVRQHRLGLEANFGSEVKALLIILAFFSFSFLARFLIDTFFADDIYGESLQDHCKDAEGYDMYCYPYRLILWITGT